MSRVHRPLACTVLLLASACGQDPAGVTEDQVRAILEGQDLVVADSLHRVATSGSYDDLAGRPSLAAFVTEGELAAVARSGHYDDLDGLPELSGYATSASLAAVATTGDYDDLLGRPDLSVYATSDSLAPVAASGAYGDLAGRPDLSIYATSQSLSAVATSGSYLHLADAPWRRSGVDISFPDGRVGIGTDGEPAFQLEVDGDVGPHADNQHSLGSEEARWRTAHLGPEGLHLGSARVHYDEATHSTHIDGIVWEEEQVVAEESTFSHAITRNQHAQSFTVPFACEVTRLRVNFPVNPNQNLRFQIRRDSLSGPVLADHTVPVGDAGDFTWHLGTPAAIVPGTTYLWVISGSSVSMRYQSDGTYPGGEADNNPSRDYYFRLHARQGVSGTALTVRDGRVGIGVEDPQHALHVAGGVAGTGPYIELSDGRLKEQVEPIDGALDRLLSVRGVFYRWRDDAGPGLTPADGRQVGFVAQEIAAVLPEAVTVDSTGRMSVAYSRVVPMLVEALRGQQAVIARQAEEADAMRRSVEALESRLSRIEAQGRR